MLKKPRMRRRAAHRDHLKLSKSKKRTAKKIREGVRKQLQYIWRDNGFIVDIIRKTHLKGSEKVADYLNTITTLYEQQLYTCENRVYMVPDRIVAGLGSGQSSAEEPMRTPNLEPSCLSAWWMAMQKSSVHLLMPTTKQLIFFSAVEGYRQEHGCYPQRILVDKIYRNWETISWCKAQGIQLTGPALGRLSKNAERTKQAKKQKYQDICDRNIVEGKFGVGKRSYGLNRIMAHLQETSFCVIGIALLCMNLAKRLRSLGTLMSLSPS